MEKEIIYLIGSKGKDREWRKLVKCLDQWFYTEKEAINHLENFDPELKEFYAVFELEITIDKVKKIFDGRAN